MKRLAVLLIIIGILVAAYPVMQRVYSWYWQERLFREWEEELTQVNDKPSEGTSTSKGNLEAGAETNRFGDDASFAYPQLNDILESMNEIDGEEEITNQEDEEDLVEHTTLSLSSHKNMIGIIEIEKISSRLPILEGTSADILKIGAGKLDGSAPIGECGNTVISAHRSHTYGRMFNRLDEVEIGDMITITTREETYIYEVYDIMVVEPTDESVLLGDSDDKVLTLITCTPLYTASHRLIVHARLQ